jgi:hypothetical protein
MVAKKRKSFKTNTQVEEVRERNVAAIPCDLA